MGGSVWDGMTNKERVDWNHDAIQQLRGRVTSHREAETDSLNAMHERIAKLEKALEVLVKKTLPKEPS